MSPCRRSVLRCVTAALLAQSLASAFADLPDVVAKAKPSVVLVGTYAATDNPRFNFRGTGFVVADGNLVVTNLHVLPPPEALAGSDERKVVVQVRRTGSEEWGQRAAKVVELDRAHDLALLRFEGSAAPAMTLAADVVREGQSIALMGFPLGGALGFSTVTHRGIVSAVTSIALPSPTASGLNERAIRQLRAGSFDIYQLDATAYPGNSGGPVIDAQTGEVLGILNMVLVKGSKESALSQPTGISYAIPVGFVRQLLQ